MSGRPSSKKTSPAWRRSVSAGVVALVLSPLALACGPGAAQHQIQSPENSSKFALASIYCAKNVEVKEPASIVQATAPADSATHAQQLWLYENGGLDATAIAVHVPPLVPQAASPLKATPPNTYGKTRLPKNMSRESASRALALVPQISKVAEEYRIDPLLLHAIAHVESRHNPDVVSHAGAVGLMQVMPATARRFGVTSPHSELRDPRISLKVSSAYLKVLQKRFDNNLVLIIAAYNAGEGAVEKYGRKVPPYKETQGYVRDVMAHYRLLLDARDATLPVSRLAL
ncbi:MAG: hypothetical protein RLZZ618_810 [Pseudomonadota bacterium]|jgi:soluble lytic murein transglycosylase-like protein